MADPAEPDREGGGDSFAAFVAERDVECPACGYNLRGLTGKRCPECGASVGWGAFALWGPASEPRLFRAADAGMISGATLALGLLAFRSWGAVASGLAAPIGAAVVLPVVSLVGTWLWLKTRRRAARWPGHVQGRAATLAWALTAAQVLVAVGAGAL